MTEKWKVKTHSLKGFEKIEEKPKDIYIFAMVVEDNISRLWLSNPDEDNNHPQYQDYDRILVSPFPKAVQKYKLVPVKDND